MINEFLQYLQYEKNYSSHTVLSYHNDLSQFAAFINQAEEQFDPHEVTSENIQQWVLELMSENYNARSLARKISTLKTFWRFLKLKNYTTKNPTTKIILPKTKKPLPAFFKKAEMETILDDAFLPEGFEPVRDRLIILLLYVTGMRLSELISIEDSSVDLCEAALKVTGKRNKQRIIPISMEVCKEVDRYIQIRNEEVEIQDSNLFLLKSGKKLYPKMVYNLVHNSMSNVSSLAKKSPHILRHTFATGLMNEGADINAVKELLGHSSLAATQVYTHTTFDELNKIYKRTHPRVK